MKNTRQITRRSVFLFAIMMFVSTLSYAASFTAIASGNWSSTTTWGGTVPSFSNLSDQIDIPSGITVTLDNEYTMNGLLAELTVNGTLNSSNTIGFNAIYGSLKGSGNITVGSASFGTSSYLFFTGTLTTNSFSNSMSNLLVSSNIVVNNNLYLTGGILNLQSGGSLTLATNANIIMTGGSLINNGGSLLLGSNYNVTYSGSGNANAGAELSSAGLNNVTIDMGNSGTVILSNDLTVKGMLTLTSGALVLNAYHLTINGNVASSGTGTVMPSTTSNISLTSSTGMTGTLRFGESTNNMNNLLIDVGGSNQAAISGNLKVNGSLILNSGVLKLESADLNISGNIAGSGSGSISSSGTSNIVVNTSVAPSGGLQFIAGGNTVNNFSVNVMDAGFLKINSDLLVTGNLNFTAGHLDIGNNTLTIGSSGSITGYNSNAYIVTGVSGALSINVTAGNSSATAFPVGTATLYFPANVWLNSGSNSGSVMVGVRQNIYAQGNSGADITLFQHAVDATWDVKSNVSSNLNMNLQLMWNTAAEVNGFNRSMAYISHYTAGHWDASTQGAATSAGAGMYSLTRANITSLSPFAVFDNTTTTGIIELNNSQVSYEIYPNPVSGTLYINFKGGLGDEAVKAEVMNIDGKVVATYDLGNDHPGITVADLPAGVYFIRVNNSVNKFTKM